MPKSHPRYAPECSGAAKSTPAEAALNATEREDKQLRQERDILSRAAAWFARETGTIPSGSSSS